MDDERFVSEEEFKKILVAQIHVMLGLMVTIGTLNAVLADQGVLPLDKMSHARRIVENDPHVVMLRKSAAEILDSASILEFLQNLQGTIQ